MQKSWRQEHARHEQQDGKIFCVVKAQEPELISGSEPGKKSGAKARGTSYGLEIFGVLKKFEVDDCDIFKK